MNSWALASCTHSRKQNTVGNCSLSKIACTVFVFCMAAAVSSPAQTFTDLYDFNNGPNDPHWNITAQGRDGNLYSTTPQVWSGQSGDVFKITPTGTLKELFTFDGTDGGYLAAGLTLGLDGNFYGVTNDGGSSGFGTIFKVTPGGAVTALYTFTNGADGAYPSAPPIQGVDGNFYGNASSCAGLPPGNVCIPFNTYGAIYTITAEGTFSVLHTFSGPDGNNPFAQLVEGTDGEFYGTANSGGTHGVGTIFKINPTGDFTLLYSFDGTHGAHPLDSALIQAYDGDFYGIASQGGSSGAGLLFKITPGGKFTIVYDFAGGPCSDPIAGVIQATDGNFYGTCVFPGLVFRVTPSGTVTNLASIGGSPQSPMVQHTNGILYSNNAVGGAADRGYFFSMNVGLAPFVRFLPVARPVGGVVQILGQGFTGATGVSFNGTSASFAVRSDTSLPPTFPQARPLASLPSPSPAALCKATKSSA
jgi:uncharacterized repeat protein (TIGR03803 family)